MRLGTLVTSPNFRHPVTLAKDLITLDDVSGGRVTLGIGAGGAGFDATALLAGGQPVWTVAGAGRPVRRVHRPARPNCSPTTWSPARGSSTRAHEVRNIPGCMQRPRIPFAVAATGPRGMALTARHGQAWVTTGDPKLHESGTPEQSLAAVRGQIDRLGAACADAGRDPAELDHIMLTGFTPDRPLDSLDAFIDFAGRHAEAGIDEIVLHWPIADTVFAADRKVFEQIATEGLAGLA